MATRSPAHSNISHSAPLALSGKRSGTKLSGAVKGATLLQLASLSADASQRASWDILLCAGCCIVIRNMTEEYKKIELDCQGGVRAQL